MEDEENSQIVEMNWVDCYASEYAGGTGKEDDPYQISCAEELAYFMVSFNQKNDTLGKYYVLTNDILLNDGFFEENGTYHDGGDGILYSWTPVGAGIYNSFNGTFDGQGHTINGFYINSTVNYRSFIYSNNGTIRNLKFKKAFLKGGGYSAIVTGATSQKSVIENVYVDAYVSGGTVAGLAGSILYGGGKFINCKMYGKINGTGMLGGILVTNNVRDNMYYENCDNYADLTTTGHAAVMGIANASGNSTFINCNNYGTIIGKYQCAGIGKGIIFENCNNYGDLRCENGTFAGIAVECTKRMVNCKNYGFVSVGLCYYNYSGSVIENCENYGDVQVGLVCTNYENAEINKCKTYSVSTFNNPTFIASTNYGIIKNIEGYLETNKNNVRVIWELKEGSEVENILIFGKFTSNSRLYLFDSQFVGRYENIICDTTTSKQFVSNDLSSFYIDYKTGKIGLKAFSGKGFYQGEVTEEYLLGKGYEKKTV